MCIVSEEEVWFCRLVGVCDSSVRPVMVSSSRGGGAGAG